MKNRKFRFLALAVILMSATPSAVFASTVNNGPVSAAGPNGTAVVGNVTGINENSANAAAAADATAITGDVWAGGGSVDVMNSNSYESTLQAAGFIGTPSINGPADGEISEVISSMFVNGITMDQVEAAIAGVGGREKWNSKCNKIDSDEPMSYVHSNTLSKTGNVYFVMSGSGVKPGKSSRAVEINKKSISARYDGTGGFLFTEIARDAMEKGASVVYVRGIEHSKTKSKSSALSAVGKVVDACTFGMTSAASIAGSSTENVLDRIIVSYTMYIALPEPIIRKKAVEEKVIDSEIIEEAFIHCTKNCANNAGLHKQQGDLLLRKARTGKKECYALAIDEYKTAETNILKGVEPDKIKTRNMKGSDEFLKRLRFNWALAIGEKAGNQQAADDAAAKMGSRTAPDLGDNLK